MPTKEISNTFGPILAVITINILIMAVDFTPLAIPDVILIQSTRHRDKRGYFSEIYRRSAFAELNAEFVQDNFTRSEFRVLRGLHFQLEPKAQGKLIRVIRGEIFDVVVDLRTESDTFGKWLGVRMTSDEPDQLYVPPGFAHGYLVLSKLGADISYKVTQEFDPELDGGIKWNDPDLAISWPISDPILSPRDKGLPTLAESEPLGGSQGQAI